MSHSRNIVFEFQRNISLIWYMIWYDMIYYDVDKSLWSTTITQQQLPNNPWGFKTSRLFLSCTQIELNETNTSQSHEIDWSRSTAKVTLLFKLPSLRVRLPSPKHRHLAETTSFLVPNVNTPPRPKEKDVMGSRLLYVEHSSACTAQAAIQNLLELETSARASRPTWSGLALTVV